MRKVLVPLTAALVFAGSAVSASAGTPARGCPGPFEAYTSAELLALATEVFGAEGAQPAVDYVFETFNKNGDDTLCVQDLRHTKGGDPHRFNFIDNVAK